MTHLCTPYCQVYIHSSLFTSFSQSFSHWSDFFSHSLNLSSCVSWWWKFSCFLTVGQGWKQMAVDRGRGLERGQWATDGKAHMPPSPPSLPNSPVTICGKIQSSSRLRVDIRSPRMRRPIKIELWSESTLSRGVGSGAIHDPFYRETNVQSWLRIKRDHRNSAFFLSPLKETSGFPFITM